MQNATLERIERHAFRNLLPCYQTARGYTKRMQQIDDVAVPALKEFTAAEVAVWMCGRVAMFGEHLKGKRKRRGHADATPSHA